MHPKTHSTAQASRWLMALILALVAGRLAHADDAVNGVTIMERVLANRPAVGLWLEIELRVERKTAESYNANFLLNGDPRGPRTACRITAPDEMAGTALLMIEGGDCWFREKGKTEARKLTPAERATPFLGGDFAYEDLEMAFLRWPNQKFVRESRRLGFDCWVIESAPKTDLPSQYLRVLSWVDKQWFAPVIAEAYDRQNKLLKTLEIKSVRKVTGKDSIAGQIALTNTQTKSRTVLRVLEDHKAVLPPELFAPETFFKFDVAVSSGPGG